MLEPVFEALSSIETPDQVALGAELARSYMLTGSLEQSVDIADRVLLPAEQLELIAAVVDTLITRATAIGGLGRPKEGVALLHGAIRLSEDYDLPHATMRAVNNLAVVVGADDAHAQEEADAQLYEHARRVGDAARILNGGSDLAIKRVNRGDFVGAIQLLQDVDVAEMSGQWPSVYGYWLAFIQGMQTGEARYWEEAEGHLSFWDDATDPQLVGLLAGFRTWAFLYQGHFQEALEAAAQTDWDPPFPFRIHGAIHAAAWLGDTEQLERVVAELREQRGRGRRIKGLRLFADAARAALAGRREESAELFNDAIELWAQTATELELMLLQASFAKLVGQDHPDARAAAEAAYRWLSASDCRWLQELLSDGLPPAPTIEAASG